ncbi:ATP-dependent nuclease [Undibacterium terreum]|uniref:ATP-dependent nuclease n=1 Tax=Undibacterium terreum TaxID=1224302 RepID=UPI001666DCAF|nr:ATP-binding protein [Undibacterium terreum]
MARVRKVEIRNFRSIRVLDWFPSGGINCLVGPGDSGKSSILDAIDLCIGARRSISVDDTDFFGLDVTQPISITLTIGELPDALKNINTYGDFLRAFDPASGQVEEEPRQGLETVLALRLEIGADLEPVWTLISARARELGLERGISWKDRGSIAPARLGNYANSNLSWSRGSVLNRLSGERANLGAELARAAREARANFGNQAGVQFAQTLQTVTATANSLGVSVGASATALLDAHAVSIGDGAITLHSEAGVPLRSLGTGSVRLLIAGLQRAAADSASIILIDEVEYGLEPHRLTRLLDSLGAKEPAPPLQVFMTTHSPVAVRELSGNQIFVVRSVARTHSVRPVGVDDDVQSTIRADPEAFLARTVIVCEGASEVGFVRGMDAHYVSGGQTSLLARGVAYVNVGGGDPDRCFIRGNALLTLGYRAIVLVDNDKPPTPELRRLTALFEANGGTWVSWRQGRALEDELFASLNRVAVGLLIQQGIENVGDELVDAHIRTQSQNQLNLQSVLAEGLAGDYSPATRTCLGVASRHRKNGWFKSVTKFEHVARTIVFPNFADADAGFSLPVLRLYGLAHAA